MNNCEKNNKYVIMTENLQKSYGSQIRVKDLSLCVPKASVYGFLGPNGAGKTTTLKLLLGLIHPDRGNVWFFGEKMNKRNRLQILRHTGSLIEGPSFYGHLTGLENLQIIAKLKGVPSKEITRALETVRLTSQKDKKVKHYSLGMKQRLGIAMALLGNPEILILDEPTNGLDPAGIQEIRALIKELARTRSMTIIISSHILSEIEQMADHVGIIYRGELIFQGLLSELENQGGNLEEVFLSLTGGAESL